MNTIGIEIDSARHGLRIMNESRQSAAPLLTNTTDQRLLMTVLPCLAHDEKELVLPAEVVKQDVPSSSTK